MDKTIFHFCYNYQKSLFWSVKYTINITVQMPLQSLSEIASANLNIMACLFRRKEFRTTEAPKGIIILVYLLLIRIQTNFTSIMEYILKWPCWKSLLKMLFS